MALSAGPPRPPERPSMAMAPSSELIMLTSEPGPVGGAPVGPRRPPARPHRPPRAGSGHNRCIGGDATGGRLGAMAATDPAPRSALPADHHHHVESHRAHRAGWLRAAVLGRQRRRGVHRRPHRRRRRQRGRRLGGPHRGDRGSRGRARCRWRQGSTCPSPPSATSRRRTCGWRSRRSAITRVPNWPSWPRSGGRAGSSRRWPRRSPASSPTADALGGPRPGRARAHRRSPRRGPCRPAATSAVGVLARAPCSRCSPTCSCRPPARRR